MKKFRNVRIFYEDINKVIDYLEDNNKKPTLIITKLPKFSVSNDKLGRVITTSIILDSMNNARQDNLLRRLFNICNQNAHIYIMCNEDNIYENKEFMSRAGFIYHNLLVYKTKRSKKRDKTFRSSLGYILFFTKENNYTRVRLTNKINNKENNNFIDLKEVNITKDYPKRIVDRIFSMSKLEVLDENIIVDLQSEEGIVPKTALENNMECVALGMNRIINSKLSTYLTGIENRVIEDKVEKIKEIKERDYKEKNEKISKSMKKTLLKNKINKLKNNIDKK